MDSSRTIKVGDIEVQMRRRRVRTLRLVVSPPEGRVRVSVPLHVSEDEVRRLIEAKAPWIKRHQARCKVQPPWPASAMVPGERHYLFGEPYVLQVIERHGRHRLVVEDASTLVMYVTPDTALHRRRQLLYAWYRAQLKQRIPELIAKWEPVIGKQVAQWGVKKMKTRWGSCNIVRRRIWLNLELATRPLECLEYVLVHEMVHLHERYHNENFRAYMDRFLPHWRQIRGSLNGAPPSADEQE